MVSLDKFHSTVWSARRLRTSSTVSDVTHQPARSLYSMFAKQLLGGSDSMWRWLLSPRMSLVKHCHWKLVRLASGKLATGASWQVATSSWPPIARAVAAGFPRCCRRTAMHVKLLTWLCDTMIYYVRFVFTILISCVYIYIYIIYIYIYIIQTDSNIFKVFKVFKHVGNIPSVHFSRAHHGMAK